VCVILRHSRGPHHQLESTDLTSPWTEKSRMRVLPWPFRSTFASCDLVLIRTHPFAFPCVGRLITVLATRGLRWMDTKCPLRAQVASIFVSCIRAPHPRAAPSFVTRRTRIRVAWDGLGRRCLVLHYQFPSRITDRFTSSATLRSWVPDDYVARLNPRAHTGAYSLAS